MGGFIQCIMLFQDLSDNVKGGVIWHSELAAVEPGDVVEDSYGL
jgi:hypothetical protein